MFGRVLVTGSDGFIGSHLVKFLEGGRSEVRGFSMTESRMTMRGDLRDYEAVKAACEQMDAVFHLGGISNAADADSDVAADFDVNVKGTFNILRAAEKCGVKKVVFSSSAFVYGNPKSVPIPEESVLEPNTFYGQSKLAAEEYCRFYSRRGLDVVIARIFNAFGKGQAKRAIPDLIRKIGSSEVVELHGNAADSRDFISIEKVVEALVLLAEKGNPGEAYNIGSGKETTILELAKMILASFQKNDKGFKREFRFNSAEKDARRNLADISKLRRLGFVPEPISVDQLASLI